MDSYHWADAANWNPVDQGDDGTLAETETVPYTHPWDWVETALCRTVGCTGPFSQWFVWPHRYICSPFAMWRYRKGR